jgi:TRAP-type C4-dicarboxylate transport system substrate-binding protein
MNNSNQTIHKGGAVGKKRFSIIAVVIFITGLLFSTGVQPVAAKTIELKFAHPYPPMHPQHKDVLVPWAKKIEEGTGGKVKIKFLPGGALGKPGQAYDVVAKGIADIGWDICDYSPGRFLLTTVIELPFMVDTAEKAGVALWKTYEQFPEFQKEYEDVKLLALAPHAPGIFATTKKPLKTLGSLKGLKIKTASSFTTDALQLFNAVPVVQPVTETYTSLERGVVDGVTMPYDGIVIFKLNELLKYYTPANFYSMVFWVAMNKNRYESLPDDVRTVIDENSGLVLSQIHSRSFDQTYASMKQVCIKTGMQEVPFPDEEIQKLVTITEPLKAKWVKEMDAKGLPGKAVLETITGFLK